MYDRAYNYIKQRIDKPPKVAIILGSGLGELSRQTKSDVTIDFSDIPGFAKATVEGHKGQFIFGELYDKYLMIMNGRLHYYEGHSMKDITFPIRLMRKLGIKIVIITNAAGGINRAFKPGDLMIIKDHINLMGTNPLLGKNMDQFGPRFPDLCNTYDRELISMAKKCADKIGLNIKSGIYAAMSGPSYETPAEIKMLSCIGADAVGMSTVPEVIVCAHCGIKVLGISCITNMAAGILDKPLSHQEVLDTADRAKDDFIGLIKAVVNNLDIRY